MLPFPLEGAPATDTGPQTQFSTAITQNPPDHRPIGAPPTTSQLSLFSPSQPNLTDAPSFFCASSNRTHLPLLGLDAPAYPPIYCVEHLHVLQITQQHLAPSQARPETNVRRHKAQIAAEMQRRIIKDWIPSPLSPEEVALARRHTVKRIAYIRAMEAELSRGGDRADTRLEDTLILARIEHGLRFFRIFRVNDLPPEILTNIFRFVVWSSADPKEGVHNRVAITCTCRMWREVALEDATLWSAIWFRDGPGFERSLVWFDRAGAAPLDLRINDMKDYKFTGEKMKELLDVLFTKISNIRILIVIVEDWGPVLMVLDKLRAVGEMQVPLMIERFELHRTGTPYVQIAEGYQPSSLRNPMALFGGVPAPSLKYISVNGVHLDWVQSHLRNLTTIDIRRVPLERSPTIHQFRDLLLGSPALRKLCLDGAGPQWHPDLPLNLIPVTLPNLKILVIADFSLHYAFYILSLFMAPGVRDLTVMNFVGEDYSPLFGAMISRFPEVRILTVYSVETVYSVPAGRAIVKWLDSMPALTYLRVANVQKLFLDAFLYDPLTFQYITQQTSSPRRTLGPNLKYLEFHVADPDLIARWGVSRRTLNAPLQKIYIGKEQAKRLGHNQYMALTEAASLFVVEDSGKAPEEEDLMD